MRDETWNLTVVSVGIGLIVAAFWAGRLTAPSITIEKTIQLPAEQIYHLPDNVNPGIIRANLQAEAITEIQAYKTGWMDGWKEAEVTKCGK